MSSKRYCSKCGKEFDGNSLAEVVILHLNRDHKLPLDSKALLVEVIATAMTSLPPTTHAQEIKSKEPKA